MKHDSRYPLPPAGGKAAASRGSALDRFVQEAVLAGAQVCRCASHQIRPTLLRALERQPVDAAVRFESPDLLRAAGWEPGTQKMCGGWMADLRQDGPLMTREFEMPAVLVGVTGADFGLADTGTLVLQTSDRRGRLLSALPPVHVAILEAQRILPDLAAFLAQGCGDSSAVAFVTGPSKTADIEQTLTVGVHGPAELHIVLVG
ncbi:MAG: lactate utilization protein [Acidobacteria bacterium]|nr:lactate utilization protein [Acidobacteriota bacterium]